MLLYASECSKDFLPFKVSECDICVNIQLNFNIQLKVKLSFGPIKCQLQAHRAAGLADDE